MRLKKGDTVEVMNKTDTPVSWRVAKILSSNGHTYRVQYDSYRGMSREKMVETVSRKFVKPCPPFIQGVENCIAGDIVEVFYEYTWKMAAILRVLEGRKETKSKKNSEKGSVVQSRHLVRLLGCSQELIVDESNIRIRQIWKDDKWILIGKNSRGGEDVKAGMPSSSIYYQNLNFQIPQTNEKQPQNDCLSIQEEAVFRESDNHFSRSLKRMTPYGSSIVEAHYGHAEKLRAIEKDGRKQRLVAAPVLEKGHNWRHASFASKA